MFAPTQNLTQGTKKDQFVGDEIWIKGFSIRGQISNVIAIGYNSFHVRFTLVWSRTQGLFTGTSTFLGNNTTAQTNPTQVAPLTNPPLFDSTALPFVGDGYVVPFDTDNNLKVLASKDLIINPGGNSTSLKKFKIFFPVRSKYHYQDVGEDAGLTTAPNYGKWGTYYIVRQVIGNAGSVANTQLGLMDYQSSVYFRDP